MCLGGRERERERQRDLLQRKRESAKERKEASELSLHVFLREAPLSFFRYRVARRPKVGPPTKKKEKNGPIREIIAKVLCFPIKRPFELAILLENTTLLL